MVFGCAASCVCYGQIDSSDPFFLYIHLLKMRGTYLSLGNEQGNNAAKLNSY